MLLVLWQEIDETTYLVRCADNFENLCLLQVQTKSCEFHCHQLCAHTLCDRTATGWWNLGYFYNHKISGGVGILVLPTTNTCALVKPTHLLCTHHCWSWYAYLSWRSISWEIPKREFTYICTFVHLIQTFLGQHLKQGAQDGVKQNLSKAGSLCLVWLQSYLLVIMGSCRRRRRLIGDRWISASAIHPRSSE